MAEEMKLVVLDSKEQARLDELCGVVDRGIQTFFEVGMALAEIRDSKLYRETHGTFEEFCRDKWDISKRHVDRQISAYLVCRNINGTHGSQNDVELVPGNERQVRPLTEFDADTQRELWQRAIEYSIEVGTGKVTGAIVSAVVAEYLRKKAGSEIEKTRKHVSREAVIDPEFKQLFQGLLDQVSKEMNSGFKTTSRVAVLQYLDTLRDLVAKAKG